MATANFTTTPKPVLLTVPGDMRLEARTALLKPLNLCLHWRPDQRPAVPQTGNRTAQRGTRT